MMRIPWDIHFMDHALLAADMSTCLTRKTGAVVVRDRRMIASGFNGNVPGATHCVDGGCERCARRAENSALINNPKAILPGEALGECVCVHAEANAIAQCARLGQAADHATVYATHRPCLDCVKLIAVAGIIRVVYLNDYPAKYTVPPTVKIEVLNVV
jgi:dCMP deaminase